LFDPFVREAGMHAYLLSIRLPLRIELETDGVDGELC